MSLFAFADVHITESTSLFSSNRTPAVVVIFCGGMLYNPKPVCRFLPSWKVPATPTNQSIGVVHRLGLEALDPGLRNVLVLQERRRKLGAAGGRRTGVPNAT